MLAALVFVLAAASLAAREVPFLSGRVVDEGGFFSSAGLESIEDRLVSLEQRGAAQMAVLTVDSLEGDPLEDYSMRVVETWQLGDAERDDGLLLLISRQERALRLEVGYGLEDQITDAHARRILDRIVTPAFRAREFDQGVLAAVDAVDALLQGQEVPALADEEPVTGWRVLLVIGLFLLPLLVVFIVMVTLGARLARGSRDWSSRGGWSIPISLGSGRSYSSGSSFGGGFSGGGGSFGGGGASGGW